MAVIVANMAPRRSSHWATSRQPRSKAWYIGVQPNIILSADVLGSANYEEKLGYTNVTVKAGAMNGIRIKMKYASAEPTNFLRHGVICDAALPAIWSGSLIAQGALATVSDLLLASAFPFGSTFAFATNSRLRD